MPSGSASGSSSSSRPRASEVAADTKKRFLKRIQNEFPNHWKNYSYYYAQPLHQVQLPELPSPAQGPTFRVYEDDPVDYALRWSASTDPPSRVALICAANDKRPGGDWVTGVVGYEERLCRRSTLSVTLSTPGPGSPTPVAFPISTGGGIFSEEVVIFRGGEHDRYKDYDPSSWRAISVCSVPPVRWPKVNLNAGYLQYSFSSEREMMQDKIRGALAICAANGIGNIVIGDFGMGNGHRNPPAEMAAFWTETVLCDPLLRGRIHHVAFIFEDPRLSTATLILDDLAKKATKGGGSLPSNLVKALKEKAESDYHLFFRHFEAVMANGAGGSQQQSSGQ